MEKYNFSVCAIRARLSTLIIKPLCTFLKRLYGNCSLYVAMNGLGYIDLRCFVLLTVADALYTSKISFASFTFMHCVALSAVWSYCIPETFLYPTILFATFVAARNAQRVSTVMYVPTYFKFSVHYAFTNFRIHFYYKVFVLFSYLQTRI
jgi:hypothetical protein